MKFTTEDTDRLLDILRWRRDVRHFLDDPLAPEEICRLKEAMALAPSVGNSRPWRVIEVSTKETREKIIANHTAANDQAAKLYEKDKKAHYLSLKLAGLREAPLQLAIFTDPDPWEGHGLGRQTMPETLVYSTVSAIHNMWLVARSMNIGLGWVSIVNPSEMNAIFGVDNAWIFTAYLCIGYPKDLKVEPELQERKWQHNDEPEWLIQ